MAIAIRQRLMAPDEGRGGAFAKPVLLEGQKQARVLFVDDERVIRMIAARIITNLAAGYSVTCAENGAEALKMLKENPKGFDLIMLDCTMPEMDGTDVFERMAPEQQEKVIFQTGASDGGKSLEWTGRPVLLKPWNADLLLEAIAKAGELKRTD